MAVSNGYCYKQCVFSTRGELFGAFKYTFESCILGPFIDENVVSIIWPYDVKDSKRGKNNKSMDGWMNESDESIDGSMDEWYGRMNGWDWGMDNIKFSRHCQHLF